MKAERFEISEVTKTFFDQLLESFNASGIYKPIGKFIYKEGKVWFGVDNSTGNCWVEEFPTEIECRSWLAGEFEIGEN